MSDKSATPILVAGAVGTVVLLAIAWMFAASAGRQAVVDAEAYAAEKAAISASASAEVEAKAVANAEAAEAEAKAVAEAEAAEAEAKAAAEAEAAEAEAKKAAEAAEAESKRVAEAKAAAEAEAAEAEEVAEAETAAATTAAAPTTAALATVAGDIKAGKKVFRKCRACHKIGDDGKHSVGPNLTGVVGREIGSAEGFSYSDVFKAAMDEGATWTPDNLAKFLTKPKEFMPGTKMSFPGLRKDEDRANVIAFLSQGE